MAKWHGWSSIFSSTSIDIMCSHIPQILRGCNCVGMLYICTAWICKYLPHNTGEQGLCIFRWRPGSTSCIEGVTCSWLSKALWHKWFASLVPYDDDITVRPWLFPSVFMYRRWLHRVLIWRPMSFEVRMILWSDFKGMHFRKRSQDTRLFNIIGQRTRSQFHLMALIFNGSNSVNVYSIKMKQKRNVWYTSGYAAMLFKFWFHFWF